MDHVIIKVIAIIGLFCITLFAGILPYKIGHGGSGRQQILSLCNCFAGGVFFATSFLDLLPMIREKFHQSFAEQKIAPVFPVPEFTTCMGFFIVLILEQVIHSCHSNAGFLHGHGHDVESKAPLLESSRSYANGYGHTESVHSATEDDTFSTTVSGRPRSTSLEQVDSTVRIYILVFALSLHSIFEGLALGLITEVDRLIQIAAAVVIHKSIISFSMGVSMVQHSMRFGVILKASLLFSMMGPLGIGIGIGVLKSTSYFSSNLSSAILQGIANGTFIYVTFFEILQNELKSRGNKLLKVLFMVLGYAVVSGLLYFANVLEHKTHHVVPHANATTSLGLLPF